MLCLNNIIRAEEEPIVNEADDTTSKCIIIKRKRKRKEDLQDIDNEVSRPMTRSRVALPDTNRRITRSMTKAMRDAKPSGDGRGTTQTKSVRYQGTSSRRKHTARYGRKRKATQLPSCYSLLFLLIGPFNYKFVYC